jgi:cell division protein FtsN
MTMRKALPYLLALALGVGSALLVACGDSTKNGIPSADAGDLKSQLEDVRQAVDDARCDEVGGQLRQVEEGIDGLPTSVDAGLRERLREAGDNLRARAVEECNENLAAEQAEEEPDTQTETQETVTQTVPPETETQPPAETVPPAETQPPATQPPPVEPLPEDPGAGGTPPEVP